MCCFLQYRAKINKKFKKPVNFEEKKEMWMKYAQQRAEESFNENK